MAGTLTRTGFIMATVLAGPTHAADETARIRYDLAFHMQGEVLETVEVRVIARTDADGVVDFNIPAKRTADVHAEKGRLDTSRPGHWILRAAPGRDVALTWRSQPAAPSRTLTEDLWQSVLVRPDALAASTNVLFAIPEGSKDRWVEVHWKTPADWAVSTSLTEGIQSIAQLEGGTFMAARHARTSRARAGDATITVTTLDSVRDIGRAASDVARAVSEVTSPASRHDYTLNIVDLDGKGSASAMSTQPFGGTAYMMADTPEGAWMQWLTVAAALPERSRSDPSVAWFAEGFTASRIVRKLLADGYLTPASFARLANEAMTGYGNSPFRRAPQSQVLEEYATSRDMRELSVNRGAMFAWLLDAHIREATGGKKSLDDVLERMKERDGDPAPALVHAVVALGAGDITPLYRRYIVEGDLIQLPRDALGPCFTIGTVADWSGWQVQHVFAKPSCQAEGNLQAAP